MDGITLERARGDESTSSSRPGVLGRPGGEPVY